jgi:hypothetical protein
MNPPSRKSEYFLHLAGVGYLDLPNPSCDALSTPTGPGTLFSLRSRSRILSWKEGAFSARVVLLASTLMFTAPRTERAREELANLEALRSLLPVFAVMASKALMVSVVGLRGSSVGASKHGSAVLFACGATARSGSIRISGALRHPKRSNTYCTSP